MHRGPLTAWKSPSISGYLAAGDFESWGGTGQHRNHQKHNKTHVVRKIMATRLVACVVATGLSLTLAGCFQATLEPASDANLKPRDRKMLAAASYSSGMIPVDYRRSIVTYH